jgi:capsular polysaccharide transport system permease protein
MVSQFIKRSAQRVFSSLLGVGKFILSSAPIWIVAILAWGYYTTQVHDRYQTTSVFVVRGNQQVGTAMPGVSALLGIPDSGFSDAFVVREYIQSLEMLNELDKEFNLIAEYEQNNIDRHFHLEKDSKTKDVLNYYRDLVQVNYDQLTGLITLKVQDFSAKRSSLIARHIIKRSEAFINQMSHSVAEQQLGFVDEQFIQVRDKLSEAQERLLAFQDKNGVINPVDEASLQGGLISTLESELAAREIELETASTYLTDDSFKIDSLKEQVSNLRKKLASARSELAGTAGSRTSNAKVSHLQKEFQDLSLDVKFWTDTYASTLGTVQKTKMETLQQLKFLLMVTQPFTPVRSEFPNRPYIVLTLTMVAALLYGVIRLVVLTIWDHEDH